jgi:hypothetical protein
MGMTLLEWLATRTLPEEARLADTAYAGEVARAFVRGLARNGTTAALVFGSHFPAAQEALFAQAERSGLRITSGLVVSDRNLLADLHSSPEDAYAQSRALRERWHGRGRLRYAVTPRFSLSCTDAMLECCGALCGRPPRRVLHEPSQREPGRDPGGGRALPVVAGLTSTRTSAPASSAGARSSRTTCTSPTTSSPACTPPTRASPTARRATPSWRAASSRWRAQGVEHRHPGGRESARRGAILERSLRIPPSLTQEPART